MSIFFQILSVTDILHLWYHRNILTQSHSQHLTLTAEKKHINLHLLGQHPAKIIEINFV